MPSVAQVYVAWELYRAGAEVKYIAERVGKHRATIYRWLKGIRVYGIQGFVKRYKNAKKGRRVRKTHAHLEQRVLSLRREYRGCCGQKIVYLLKQEGITLSLSTVYRILNKHLTPRKHHRTPKGEAVQRATRPREVIQMDTLDLGELYAFTAIDTFTKEAQVVIRPSLQAEDGKAALEQIMRAFVAAKSSRPTAAPSSRRTLPKRSPTTPTAIASHVRTRRMSRLSSSASTALSAARSSGEHPSRTPTSPWPSGVPVAISTTITTSGLISPST